MIESKAFNEMVTNMIENGINDMTYTIALDEKNVLHGFSCLESVTGNVVEKFHIRINDTIASLLIKLIYNELSLKELRRYELYHFELLDEDKFVERNIDLCLLSLLKLNDTQIYTKCLSKVLEKIRKEFVNSDKYQSMLKRLSDEKNEKNEKNEEKEFLKECIPYNIMKSETYSGLILSKKDIDAIAECILHLAKLKNIDIKITKKGLK